jgi:hypothetical protein
MGSQRFSNAIARPGNNIYNSRTRIIKVITVKTWQAYNLPVNKTSRDTSRSNPDKTDRLYTDSVPIFPASRE